MNNPTNENPIVAIIKQSDLEEEKSKLLLEKYAHFYSAAAEWEAQAKELIVTDESQTKLMKLAREGRLFLKAKRVDIEKTRKALKEESLKEGRAIDSVAKFLKELIEPIEKHLEAQEKFVEIKEAEAKATLRAERLGYIQEWYDIHTRFGVAVEPIKPIEEMSQEQFKEHFINVRAHARELLEKEREEKERIAKLEEENKRLAEEKAKQEKELAQERAEREALIKEKQESERIEREAKEKAEKERQELIQQGDQALYYDYLRRLLDVYVPLLDTVELSDRIDSIRSSLKALLPVNDEFLDQL